MTASSNTTFDEIAAKLAGAQSILVASHVRPDGDAYGSVIAMALWLQQQGKTVTAWNEDGMLEKFSYLPNHQMIVQSVKEPISFDAVVALDTSTQERLGKTLLSSVSAPLWVNMDHHISNECYGTLNYIDASSPATGQLLYDFFAHVGADITPAMASNLYAAISTDTGSFQYPSTTVRTFEVAAHLVRCGVEVGKLSQEIYESYPRRRLELLRELLNSAKFSGNDRVASFSLSSAVAERLGVLPEDNEGLIDNLRSINGVVAAVFFEELPGEGKVRVSMRSKDPRLDVCKACNHFGGGGHTLAAGARVKGSLAEVEQQVLEYLCNESGKLN
ncbi:MAG: bifunctional oligoribonuclease/PAP phosphatase NrnA [Chthoniobacterales bacterium]